MHTSVAFVVQNQRT